MRTIKDYISEAQKKNAIPSNNKLAIALGVSSAAICDIYSGHNIPSDDTMLKLADLAGIAEDEALIDLAVWRAKTPKSKEIWEKIRLIMINLCLATALILPFGSGNLATSENN